MSNAAGGVGTTIVEDAHRVLDGSERSRLILLFRPLIWAARIVMYALCDVLEYRVARRVMKPSSDREGSRAGHLCSNLSQLPVVTTDRCQQRTLESDIQELQCNFTDFPQHSSHTYKETLQRGASALTVHFGFQNTDASVVKELGDGARHGLSGVHEASNGPHSA